MTPERKKHRILIVEDQATDAFLILRALRKRVDEDYIDIVSSGTGGMTHLLNSVTQTEKQGSSLPQLIIMDLNMPGLGGFELLTQIKTMEALRAIPLVVFTSSSEKKDIKQAFISGANSYLVKPNSLSESEFLLNQVIDYWFDINQNAVA